MIGKFKDIMNMKEEVDDLKSRMDAQGSSFNSFSAEITKLCDNLQVVRNTQTQLLDEMKMNLGSFSQIHDDLSKEVYFVSRVKHPERRCVAMRLYFTHLSRKASTS